jgi:hypothetical protein
MTASGPLPLASTQAIAPAAAPRRHGRGFVNFMRQHPRRAWRAARDYVENCAYHGCKKYDRTWVLNTDERRSKEDKTEDDE